MELEHGANFRRVCDARASELIGIARGMIADGVIQPAEADFLVSWIGENWELDGFPFNVLKPRIAAMMADGVIDAAEREELLHILRQLTGVTAGQCGAGLPMPTELPLTDPAPEICFDCDKVFCFTGKFAYGQRKDCIKHTREAGAQAADSLTMKTDYLVIGTVASGDWAHSSYGRKIEQAMNYNDRGCCIAIISEETWVEALLRQH